MPHSPRSAHRLGMRILMAALGIAVFSLLAFGAVANAQADTIEVFGYQIERDRVSTPLDRDLPLTKELRIQAAYNGEDILIRAQFPTEYPSIHHDTWVYENGEWVRYGASPIGSDPYGAYEDRFTFHVDDGAVRGFANQGCWAACHSDLRDPFMYAAPTADEVQENDYYRDVISRTDVRKYTVESRNPTGEWWDVQWDDISADDADRIQALKDAGAILDQWHWRAHRGGPLGVSDSMWVLDYRNGDAGRSAYATNWDDETQQPLYMFDPDRAGYAALNWDDVLNRRVTMDQAYYLGPDTMVEFDPDHAWQNGDAIPRNYLREPEGSRAAITADGNWDNGWWTVEMRRAMDTGNPDDKAFYEFRTYNIAFAFYTEASGNRFHYITFPKRLGVGQQADIEVVRFDGDAPDWNNVPVTTITSFYPGQISWQFLVSDAHAGAPAVRTDSVSCAACHGPEGLAKRAVDLELRAEREAHRPFTWIAGLLAIAFVGGAGIALRRA